MEQTSKLKTGDDLSVLVAALAVDGMKEFGLINSNDHKIRLCDELNFLKKKGLENHFLGLVHLLNFKKGKIFLHKYSSIPFGGFLISYCLGITDADPLLFSLVYERGISPRVPLDIHLLIHQDDRRDLKKYIKSMEIFSGISIKFHNDIKEYKVRCLLDKVIDDLKIKSIPLNDIKTLKALAEDTDALPSFIKSFVKRAILRVKPTNINELCVAFCMKSDRTWFTREYLQRRDNPNIEYLNKDVEEILKETKGILNYDEQIIRLAEKIGSFTREEANELRRDIGKHKIHSIEDAENKFLTYAIRNKYSASDAKFIFDKILATGKFYTISKSYIVRQAILLYRIVYCWEKFKIYHSQV